MAMLYASIFWITIAASVIGIFRCYSKHMQNIKRARVNKYSFAENFLASGKLIFITFIILFSPANNAFAERCKLVGCLNTIGYIKIPIEQFQKSFIFKRIGLPSIDDEEVLLKDIVFYYPREFSIFDGSVYKLKEDLSKEARGELSSGNFGGELSRGARVKVLGYSTFPELGIFGELFVLIQVISD